MQKEIELLAPAGTWEALEAAVNAGADAVYLGGKAFGARAYASNFDREEMAKAVYFCHMHHVRLYPNLPALYLLANHSGRSNRLDRCSYIPALFCHYRDKPN